MITTKLRRLIKNEDRRNMNRVHKSLINNVKYDEIKIKNVGLKTKLLKKVGQVATSLVSNAIVIILPTAKAAVSLGLSIACGILIAKMID